MTPEQLGVDSEITALDLASGVIADGRQVVALPMDNPHLSATLDVIGFAGSGWLVRVTDAFGTVLWTHFLKGRDDG